MKMDWKKIWTEDRQSMLETMVENMASDLKVGYDPYGSSIMNQLHEIANYKAKTAEGIATMEGMTEQKAQNWAYRDLLRRGVIE